MFKHIRWKLTITYIGIVILSLLILGSYFLHFLKGYFYENLQTRLETQALVTGRLISEKIENDDLFTIDDLLAINNLSNQISHDVGARVTIINEDGTVMGDSEEDVSTMKNHLHRPEVQQAMVNNVGVSIRHSATLQVDMMYVAVPTLKNGHAERFIRLALPLVEVKQAYYKLWSAMLLAAFLAVLLTTLVSLTLSKKITSPIEQLTDFAKKFTKDDYSYQVAVQSNDEVGKLAQTLNFMANSIREKVRLLSEEKNKLEIVLGSMNNGVIFVNSKGQVNLFNPAAEKFLTVVTSADTRQDSAGFINNPELSTGIQAALDTGQVLKKEIKTLAPVEAIHEVTVSPIYTNEELVGVVAVLHDITQIRKLTQMRTEFVANASHELKTPVTAIKGFTETLLDGALYDQEICHEFIGIIDSEASRLNRLIQDILELSRVEAKQVQLDLKPLDLCAMIRDAMIKFQTQLENNRQHLDLHFSREPVLVSFDQDMLEQVLINLVDNAIKYTPAGGKIQIEVADKQDMVVVWVKDNGIGIPPADRHRIFERFYRVDKTRSRTRGGTGLGLSIVKHIIGLHGGTVGVSSNPGEGAEFFFTIPRRRG